MEPFDLEIMMNTIKPKNAKMSIINNTITNLSPKFKEYSMIGIRIVIGIKYAMLEVRLYPW